MKEMGRKMKKTVQIFLTLLLVSQSFFMSLPVFAVVVEASSETRESQETSLSSELITKTEATTTAETINSSTHSSETTTSTEESTTASERNLPQSTAVSETKATEVKQTSKTITVSVEKFVLGQGYIIEPQEINVTQNWNYAQVLDSIFKKAGYGYEHSGTLANQFYLKSVKNSIDDPLAIPQELQDFAKQAGISLSNTGKNEANQDLAEFSYTATSGWMYSINNQLSGRGMSDTYPQNGDVFRVQFSLIGYGTDLGAAYAETDYLPIADKTALTKKIAQINQNKNAWLNQGSSYQEAYQNAFEKLTGLTVSQTEVNQALAWLQEPNKNNEAATAASKVETQIKQLGAITTLAQETEVRAVREAYDALSGEEKKQVAAEILQQLVQAEVKINQLKEQQKIDQLIKQIEQLPEVSQLTVADKSQVFSVKKIFDGFSSDQQKKVINRKKLQAAIDKLTAVSPSETIADSLHGATTYLTTHLKTLDEWSALALARSENPADEATRTTAYKKLATTILKADYGSGSGKRPWTDAERQTIGVLALGGDPTNVVGKNLIQLIADSDLNGTINSQIFGLIALYSKEYAVENREAKIQQLVDALTQQQLSDGGWALFGNAGDIDMTGMTLTALAPFKDQPAVKKAISNGVSFFKNCLNEQGQFFIATYYSPEPNANSQAQAVLGLAAVGEDLTRGDYQKSVTPIEALLAFQLEDGGVRWLMEDTKPDSMATAQTAHALSQVLFQQANKGVIYQFTKNPVPTLPIESEETAVQRMTKVINQLPDSQVLTLKEQEEVETAVMEYNLLSTKVKEKISAENREKLNQCSVRMTEIVASAKKIAAVEESISYLPTPENISLYYQGMVKNTRNKYESLSTPEKKQLSAKSLEKLQMAEKKIADLIAEIESIANGIENLPENQQLRLENLAEVSRLTTALAQLSETSREEISLELQEKLAQARDILEKLVVDQQKADQLKEKIENLPQWAKLQLFDEAMIIDVRAEYNQLSASQKTMISSESLKKLEELEERLNELKKQDMVYQQVLDHTQNYVLSLFTSYVPTYSNEWLILALARNGYPQNSPLMTTYYQNVVRRLQEVNGQLHSVKYTEYSRLILALTAIGKKPAEVADFDLFLPLQDFSKTIYQGINGGIFALLALNAAPQQKTMTTRKKLLDYLLEKEIVGGGWTLYGKTPTIDITAMTLQALAPYRQQPAVKKAIDRGLTFLSKQQNSAGSFGSTKTENSEEIAQVILALTALDVDPTKDSRFIKKKNLLEALVKFQLKNGGFMHVLPGGNSNGGGAPGEANGMATEQALSALVAYQRLADKKTSFYQMSDVVSLSDQETAAQVSEQIKKLTQPNRQPEAVKLARAAYDGLTEKQKKLIPAEVYQLLVASEGAIQKSEKTTENEPENFQREWGDNGIASVTESTAGFQQFVSKKRPSATTQYLQKPMTQAAETQTTNTILNNSQSGWNFVGETYTPKKSVPQKYKKAKAEELPIPEIIGGSVICILLVGAGLYRVKKSRRELLK
ncbi:hypothetical protein BAU16_08045 [Enterococcus sp. JM9B]|nr:hypothetical protein BAU16_08045 [Enterococcus sp. JM9B]